MLISAKNNRQKDNTDETCSKIKCEICLTKYRRNNCYICGICRISSCIDCLLKYIIDYSNLSRPKCIGCRDIIPFELYSVIFTGKNLEKLSKYMKKVVIAEAIPFLPVIQQIMNTKKRISELELRIAEVEECIEKLEKSKKDIDVKIRLFQLENGDNNLLTIFVEEKSVIMRQIKDLYDIVDRYYTEVMELREILKGNMIKNVEYNTKCPEEGCRGYLDDSFTCGLCSSKICRKCYVVEIMVEDEEHKCRKNDLKTMQLILEKTKPCPKCGTRIEKTVGCDQMWCIKCFTAFSYETLEIIKDNFHNPHHQEWLKRNRVANILEGHIDEINTVVSHKYIGESWILNNYLSVALHIVGTMDRISRYMETIEGKNNNPIDIYIHIDEKYLKGKYSKKKWGKKRLQIEYTFRYAVSCWKLRNMYLNYTRNIIAKYISWCKKNKLYEIRTVVDRNNRISTIVVGIEPPNETTKKKHRNIFMNTLEELESLRIYYNGEEKRIFSAYEQLWDKREAAKYLHVDFHVTSENERRYILQIPSVYLSVYASAETIENNTMSDDLWSIISSENRNKDVPKDFLPIYIHNIEQEENYISIEEWRSRQEAEYRQLLEVTYLLSSL